MAKHKAEPTVDGMDPTELQVEQLARVAGCTKEECVEALDKARRHVGMNVAEPSGGIPWAMLLSVFIQFLQYLRERQILPQGEGEKGV